MIQKKIWMYGLAALVCVLLAASTGLAAVQGTTATPAPSQPQVETGLGPAPFYNLTAPGADFVKVGVTTRVFNTLGAPSQTEPFTLAVPAVPGVVEKVFICWNYLLNGVPPPTTDAITVDLGAGPLPVLGTLCGSGQPDLCWGKDGGVSYKADVTGIIIPPVAVTIAGATDKPLGADPMAYGEGLTILVVYKVAGAPCRNVDVWCGYTSNQSGGGPASATLAYSNPYTGGDFHFFTNALDGQLALDDFFIDGILRSGAVAGTVAPGDAWQGLLGVPPGPPGTNYLYDHANDDISGFAPGPAGLTFGTNNVSDCIGHSFAAVSFPADPQLCAVIPTLSEWGLIIFSLLLLTSIVWYLRKRKVSPAALGIFLIVFALSCYFSSVL